MLLKTSLGVALVAALTVPAFAAQYYVAQDAKTMKCEVVTKVGNGWSALGGAHMSRSEANKALRADKACK